jgi:hypothetical protein
VLLIQHGDSSFLGPLGIFGAVATVGLYMYEFRGIQRCHRLEYQAKTLERKLGLSPEEGQFQSQPPRLLGNMLGPPAAGLIIYLAVIFAWFYVAGVGFGWWNKQEWRPWVLVVGGYGAALGVAWWFLRRYLRTWAGPNEDLVRSAYRAYAKRRMRVLKRGLASDVIWHLKGQKARIHDYRGREEVLGFLKKTMELAGGTFQAELRDVIADSDVVWRLESRIGCTGDYRGPKEVLGFIEKMVKHADGTIRAELRDIIADKEYVIGLHVAGGTGQRFEYFHWLVFRSVTGRSRRYGTTFQTRTLTIRSSQRQRRLMAGSLTMSA